MDPETYEMTSQSFLYEDGVMTALPVPSSESYAGDINDAGVVVGTMRAGGGFSNWHAYIFADGVVTDLNSRLQPGSGLHILYANAINSDGQIVGVAYDAQAHYHAVLLTPVAPGTPVVNIGDATVTEGHAGTQSATLTVTLSTAPSQAVTLSYSTANGTAAAGSDYQSASGTVTFQAGQTSKTISVLVNGDRAGELNETFTVNVGVTSGAAALGDSQGAVTIVDDEPRVGHHLRDEERRPVRNDAVRLHGDPVICVCRNGQPELRHSERFGTSPGGLHHDLRVAQFRPGTDQQDDHRQRQGRQGAGGAGSVLRQPLGRGRRVHSAELGSEHPGHRRGEKRRQVIVSASREAP